MFSEYQEKIFEVTNEKGRKIHCVYNHCGDESCPLIVISPQFEGTVRHGLLSMLFLVSNGFRTLRYDFTQHRGNSEGNSLYFTMTSGLDDLKAVVQQLNSPLWPRKTGLGLLSASISSRIVTRFFSEGTGNIDCSVSLVGVVRLGRTVHIANGQNYKLLLEDSDYRYGPQKGLKFDIDGDSFMQDMVGEAWFSLDSTRLEINKSTVPTYLIASEADNWVDIKDYEVAYGDNPSVLRGTFAIPNAGHELGKNFEAGKNAMRAATRCFREFFVLGDRELIEPNITEVITLNGREREREAKYRRNPETSSQSKSVSQSV